MERSGQPRDPVGEEVVDIDELALGGENKFSGLQLYYLRRLLRLVHMRQEQGGRLNGEGLRLLDRAIFSTYCDCLDQGVGSVAQGIVQQVAPNRTAGYQDEGGKEANRSLS